MNVVTAVRVPTEWEPSSGSRGSRGQTPGCRPVALGQKPEDGGVKPCKTGRPPSSIKLLFFYCLLTCWPNWNPNFAPNITRRSSDGTHVRCSLCFITDFPPTRSISVVLKNNFPRSVVLLQCIINMADLIPSPVYVSFDHIY